VKILQTCNQILQTCNLKKGLTGCIIESTKGRKTDKTGKENNMIDYEELILSRQEAFEIWEDDPDSEFIKNDFDLWEDVEEYERRYKNDL
jgi:hypothetical protein